MQELIKRLRENISKYFIGKDKVIDNLITVVKLGQSAPGMRPVILFVQFSAVDNLAALLQLDRYLFRTEAFLVVAVDRKSVV